MSGNAIDLTRVTKIFGGTKPVRALDNVDLSIAKGQFAAIVGPSGCGKSTILNLVAGFEHATSGEPFSAYVNPRAPEQAVLFRTQPDNVAFLLWFGIVLPACGVLSTVWAFSVLRVRKVSPEARSRKTMALYSGWMSLFMGFPLDVALRRACNSTP